MHDASRFALELRSRETVDTVALWDRWLQLSQVWSADGLSGFGSGEGMECCQAALQPPCAMMNPRQRITAGRVYSYS